MILALLPWAPLFFAGANVPYFYAAKQIVFGRSVWSLISTHIAKKKILPVGNVFFDYFNIKE